MGQVRQFQVEGLFGTVNHKIDFSQDGPVTIITGPNGVGKTHILRLIHAMLSANLGVMFMTPMRRANLQFADGESLMVNKGHRGGREILTVKGYGSRGGDLGEWTGDKDQLSSLPMPPWWRRLRSDRWLNMHTEEVIVGRARFQEALLEEYMRGGLSSRIQEGLLEELHIEKPTWLDQLLDDHAPILIDTKRLDTPRPKSGNEGTPSRISEYIEQVKVQVATARSLSLAASQRAESTFAARVLQPSRKTIEDDDLRQRYQEVAEQNAELSQSGLSEAQVDVKFPSSGTDSTERRVLNVFIDDWRKKLAPLLPVHEKLRTLQRIINEKFVGKQLRLDQSGALVFTTGSVNNRTRIPVHQLSSGEQHILALFTMMLFSAEAGSVVLVDEPEISLHAAWKHEFLTDIAEVARIASLQVILATHSSGIINGRWDIVQELGIGE